MASLFTVAILSPVMSLCWIEGSVGGKWLHRAPFTPSSCGSESFFCIFIFPTKIKFPGESPSLSYAALCALIFCLSPFLSSLTPLYSFQPSRHYWVSPELKASLLLPSSPITSVPLNRPSNAVFDGITVYCSDIISSNVLVLDRGIRGGEWLHRAPSTPSSCCSESFFCIFIFPKIDGFYLLYYFWKFFPFEVSLASVIPSASIFWGLTSKNWRILLKVLFLKILPS